MNLKNFVIPVLLVVGVIVVIFFSYKRFNSEVVNNPINDVDSINIDSTTLIDSDSFVLPLDTIH